MLVGFICSSCNKYVQGQQCGCGDSPYTQQLNGNVINHIDTKWAADNNGKGHWSHQFQRHFSSRNQLKKYAKQHGDTIVDGPMGCNTGSYKNPYTDAERKASIRKERKALLKQAFKGL